MTRWTVTRGDTGARWDGGERWGAATDAARVGRMALRHLRVSARRADAPIVRVTPDDWRWTWGGVELRIHRLRGRSGPTRSDQERRGDGRTRVNVWLGPDAVARLDELAREHGTRTAALERLLTTSRA